MINLTLQSNYFSVLMAISHELNVHNQDFIPDILNLEPTTFKNFDNFLIKASAVNRAAFIKKVLVVVSGRKFKSPHTITSGLLSNGCSNHD